MSHELGLANSGHKILKDEISQVGLDKLQGDEMSFLKFYQFLLFKKGTSGVDIQSIKHETKCHGGRSVTEDAVLGEHFV
jgi:hypothetical protein